MQIAR